MQDMFFIGSYIKCWLPLPALCGKIIYFVLIFFVFLQGASIPAGAQLPGGANLDGNSLGNDVS